MESIFLLITFMYCFYRFFFSISNLKQEVAIQPKDGWTLILIFTSALSILIYGHFGIAMARLMLKIV